MLKLVMAISNHGYVSVERDDRMKWTGPDDKAVFKLLTMGGTRVCGVSLKTSQFMPRHLENRKLHRLSSTGYTLEQFAEDYPGACLLGGQTLALSAIRQCLLDEVYLCRTDAEPAVYDGAQKEILARNLRVFGWDVLTRTRLGTVIVEQWVR